jgi:hypothetical protein
MGATEEGRAEAQQSYDQRMGTNERANALREQQIQEYLAKRGQSLTESNALKDSQTVAETAAAFSGGE